MPFLNPLPKISKDLELPNVQLPRQGRMQTTSDFQLIEMAVAGNEDAFRSLVERHCERVFKIAFGWCAVKEDAEDIAQDVMMQLADNIRGFKPDQAAFTTWLYRVTINAAKDAYRRKKSRETNEGQFANDSDVHGDNGVADQEIARRETTRLLESLPEKEREAVFLVSLEGFKHGEAARIVGCAESTISWRVHNARKKLKARAQQ
jgi:RNA polymerase sigma-70 factor (ECF subfamily)